METNSPMVKGPRLYVSTGVAVRVRNTVAASNTVRDERSSKVEIEQLACVLFCSVLFLLEWKFEQWLIDGSRCSSGRWSATSLFSR